MKYAILTEAKVILGPYTSKTTAEIRVEQLKARHIDAEMMLMESDTSFFGKPVGNRTNH